MADALPTWMTVANGRGLEPPEGYIGPVRCVRANKIFRGVWLGDTEMLYVPSRGQFQDCSPEWLLELDSPEGRDAAMHKLAASVVCDDNFIPLQIGPYLVIERDEEDSLLWLKTRYQAEEFMCGVGSWDIPRDINDPIVALAYALSTIQDEETG